MLGRQILEALYFLYANHLFYGQLHSGNILCDFDSSQSIKLLDITNIVTGVSSKYRYYISNLKYIHVRHCFEIRRLDRCVFRPSNNVMSMPSDVCFMNYQPVKNVPVVYVRNFHSLFLFLFKRFLRRSLLHEIYQRLNNC